jgi:predicted amino acid racemase
VVIKVVIKMQVLREIEGRNLKLRMKISIGHFSEKVEDFIIKNTNWNLYKINNCQGTRAVGLVT